MFAGTGVGAIQGLVATPTAAEGEGEGPGTLSALGARLCTQGDSQVTHVPETENLLPIL